ncbi:MAG: pentapeptide repeat-containing protein, partial [Bacteroidota bacterium]|nr:pentapeptide repeat-containing protein [Bacteroidota bacterium]
DFINCRFESCNFAMAKLGGSGLKDVHFADCKLIGINFNHCSDFLFAANFQKCVLDYASFFRKKMKKAKFTECSLKEVDFTGVDLAMAVFANCDLSRAVFHESNLEKVDFRTAANYSFDPEANKIKKAKFSLSGVPGLLGKYNIEIE